MSRGDPGLSIHERVSGRSAMVDAWQSLDRALGQIDALKVLAYGLASGGFSYRPSRQRASAVKRALRRTLARQ